MLQWGRVRMNAESSPSFIASPPDASASMGPRSDERGKPDTTDEQIEAMVSLQWGRVRMNAERWWNTATPAFEN